MAEICGASYHIINQSDCLVGGAMGVGGASVKVGRAYIYSIT